ncbi:MAG: Type 1 glutamine amidotransferase-like domain-containing protein [Oscillospiraceae bacterium]
MTVFLTSSPTGPLDRSRIVEGFDPKNRLIENLKERWKADARCLLISAAPSEAAFADGMRDHMREALHISGFSCGAFDIWDDRTEDFSEEALRSYDVVFLGGGHVPTQNAFFQRIALREKIQNFEGMIVGISAGTMNSADVVYAQPELEGEATDPAYKRFLTGLGLTKTNVLPHYQMVKDAVLDGQRVFEDITYPDSVGRQFIALVDGSYILCENGAETIWGEAYRIADGVLERICEEDQTFSIK